MKKLLIGFGALAIGVALAPGFLAFEAHVVNVTAKIENALSVPIDSIDFGTVFPQEHLKKALGISLSGSFMEEDRVDDVEYFIRQKPKCGITSDDGKILDHSSTATGHVFVGTVPQDSITITQQFVGYYVDCGSLPRRLMDVNLPGTVWNDIESYGMLPMLCPYISKHDDKSPDNDGSLNSFHEPFQIVQTGNGPVIKWNDTPGHLAKSQNDIEDKWTIDLAVPCFGGQCAQDWASFVDSINPLADPDNYTQPTTNEHKVFGCDLWVEVGGISLPGLGCKGKIDLMLVVDESGSIGATDMANVRTALHGFINALVLAINGPNAGQTSFAFGGSLDQQLTSNPALMHAAIDTLVSGGSTNLTAGIDLAQLEFDSTRDRADAPNIMLVVTDGVPNVCIDGLCSPGEAEAEAAAEALAARTDGTEIYVVGVGTGVNATYLTNSIASPQPPQHYFAGDFATLQTTLVSLVACTT